jgi:hypothetical protein
MEKSKAIIIKKHWFVKNLGETQTIKDFYEFKASKDVPLLTTLNLPFSRS